jgi:hypothetical protein
MINEASAAQAEKIEIAARAGYAARGVVYLIVGGLAVLAAIGQGGQTTGTQGALTSLLDEAFGQVLLGFVAVGLIGFAIWRLIQAIADPERHGTTAKGLALRAALLISAVTYVGLAIFALSLVFGWGTGMSSGDDQSARDWTAWLMGQPFGPWLVGGIGIIVVLVGLAHGYRAYTGRFKRHLAVPMQTMRWADPVCRFGLVARGVVFVLVGGFLLLAAIQFDPSEAHGLGGALRSLQGQPFGWVLLAVVALGLAAFGIYSLIQAIWRTIQPVS